MKKLCISLCLAAIFMTASTAAQEAAASKAPYQLIVWADVAFDEQMKLAQLNFPEKDSLPKSFINYLSGVLSGSDFARAERPDATKSLETALKIVVEIDPSTSKAKILSQDLMPRPMKVENLSEPLYRLKGEWSGRILVTCTITTSGRCAKPKIDKSTNAPAEVPKILLATLGTWRFIPQKQAGKPIEGEFSTWINFEADNAMPPESFGKHI